MVRRDAILALLLLVGTDHVQRRSGRLRQMDPSVVTRIIDFLKTPAPRVEALARILRSEIRPMPPNQFELSASAFAGIDRVEVVLSADDDASAPIRLANVIVRPEQAAALAEMEALLGAASPVEEDRRPAPAQLVS